MMQLHKEMGTIKEMLLFVLEVLIDVNGQRIEEAASACGSFLFPQILNYNKVLNFK